MVGISKSCAENCRRRQPLLMTLADPCVGEALPVSLGHVISLAFEGCICRSGWWFTILGKPYEHLVNGITLPETNIFAPENGWLEDDPFLWGRSIFRGELLVSGSVWLGDMNVISKCQQTSFSDLTSNDFFTTIFCNCLRSLKSQPKFWANHNS